MSSQLAPPALEHDSVIFDFDNHPDMAEKIQLIESANATGDKQRINAACADVWTAIRNLIGEDKYIAAESFGQRTDAALYEAGNLMK